MTNDRPSPESTAYREWWFSLDEAAQDVELARLAKIAVWMFEPESLQPNADGDVVLCHPDITEIWTTTGCEGGSWSVSLDGRQDSWPIGEVFDPYDLKKLCAYLIGKSLPVGAHQDPDHEIRRVTTALEGSWGLPPLPTLASPIC